MSNIFTIHRQPYGEVMNPVSADGVRFYDKDGDITEVRMIDGMVNIHVGRVTVSAEHLEDLMRPPSAPVGVPAGVVREYLDARACYDPPTQHPNSPEGLRLREARNDLDAALHLAQQPAAVDDAMVSDAARWRWLKLNGKHAAEGLVMRHPAFWDSAVDAARRQQGGSDDR